MKWYAIQIIEITNAILKMNAPATRMGRMLNLLFFIMTGFLGCRPCTDSTISLGFFDIFVFTVLWLLIKAN